MRQNPDYKKGLLKCGSMKHLLEGSGKQDRRRAWRLIVSCSECFPSRYRDGDGREYTEDKPYHHHDFSLRRPITKGLVKIGLICRGEAVKLKPTFSYVYLNLGNVNKALGMATEAIVCYERALQSKPDYAMAFGNLTSIYYEQGNLEMTINHYKQVIGRDAGFLGAYNNLKNLDVMDVNCQPKRSAYGLPENKFIFACFNQLYKMDPEIVITWFPAAGEMRLRAYAAAQGVQPDHVIFTDVALKNEHIRICYIVLLLGGFAGRIHQELYTMNIGKQSIAHLVYKEGLFGIGLTRGYSRKMQMVANTGHMEVTLEIHQMA
ncbi:unnamed protein product [Lactuca saligna]|uniref:protein O-GlcNAc transferase n=1 Tax=Lactuca saligna TaxID=75948 RepID=A0AA35Y660_LACSI|nr:unnamed protein product [Lactuca saligna]